MSKYKKRLTLKLTPRQTLWGWIYLLCDLFVLPVLLSTLNGLLPRPLSGAGLNFLFFCLNFLAILLIFHGFLAKSLETVGRRFWDFLQAVVLAFVAYWVCSTLLSYGITALFPWFHNVNDAGIAEMAGKHFWLMAIGTVLLVPPVEECLYRGLIFLPLQGRSRFLAYFLSTACFCLIHVMAYIGTYDPLTLTLCLIQYIPAGIWLAWAYEKSGTIFAPILMHAAINAISIYALR